MKLLAARQAHADPSHSSLGTLGSGEVGPHLINPQPSSGATQTVASSGHFTGNVGGAPVTCVSLTRL